MLGNPQCDGEIALFEVGDVVPAFRDPSLREKPSLRAETQTLPSPFHPQLWGLQIIYKSVKLPVLKVRSMLLETPRGRVQAKKWSRVPFPVPDFDYLQYCAQSLADLSLN